MRSQDQGLRRFERLLADLSARFVNLPAAEVDAAITDSLRQIVLLLHVDRSSLIGFARSSDPVEITHSWAVEGVPAVPHLIIAARYPWVIQRLKAGRALVMARVEDLPVEAAVDKASYVRAGVRSVLAAPFQVGGRVEGALTLGCVRRERDWPEEFVGRIGDIATVLGNALAHKRSREALDAAMEFERTMSGVLAAMITAPRSEQDFVIEASLHDMARVFGVERATLWQRSDDGREFTATHQWLADGVPVLPIALGASAVPWIATQVVEGVVVRIGRSTELDTDAAVDLRLLDSVGIRTGVIVPLAVTGVVVGAMAFATAREDAEWPDALVQRVKLVGEVFAGAIARQAGERRELEAQAQAAHATRVGMMGAFAASLVHELTQPLAASLANAESASDLLAAHSPNLKELRATVADILADDRRASELIQQLRRFLRRGQAERSAFHLREVVDESLQIARNEVAERRIVVALDIPTILPKVVGDRVQIQQVLLNLLLNAFEAVAQRDPSMRQVNVAVSELGTGMRIEVADTGCGMSEATLARVFEPFFSTKSGGMGLGLSISRTIVLMHGGTMAIQSAPGEGTTFSIELPTRPPDDVPTVQPMTAPIGVRGTVFVIDDDASMRRAVGRQLQGAGHRVETFASAKEFLDRAPWVGVACIVSDVRMPEVSGFDLQTALARANRELPIIFMSGQGDTVTTVDAMKAGAVNFLAKPFTKDALLAAVDEALTRSREIERARKANDNLRACYESLTPREREVFALVTEGLLNKIIADRLGAAEKTIKIHRGRMMAKMKVKSVADLVRLAERLGLPAKRVAAT